jgi:CRISPR-associated protein Csh1
MYEEHGDKLIIDTYTLGEGSYVLVKKDGDIEILEVSKKDADRANNLYSYFAQRDYISKLIDMNKPIDGKKVIHSNNYLSFFIKKENLQSNDKGDVKLTEEIIDKYYDILLDPTLKYKDIEKKSMYEKCEVKYEKVDSDKLDQNKQWIKANIFSLLDRDEIKKDKNYLKIFFEEDISQYSQESDKYIIPNIYNSTDFNISIDNRTYGLPNDNMGLNAKKPYLEQRGRKNTIPYLINEYEVLLQKKLFDFLMNNVAINRRLVYIDEKIQCYENGDRPKGKFTGYFMRLQKGKEVEIHDFDTVVNMNSRIREFEVFKPIDIDYSKAKQAIEYGTTTDIKDVEMNISNVFFNKFLHTNYFTDAKDVKLNEGKLKEILIKNRESLFNWFYKGNMNGVRVSLPKYSLEIIKNSILNSTTRYSTKAAEQYNLRYSLLNYFNMGDLLKDTKNFLREKVNSKETQSIQSDEEYYFAIGQIANYLISLSKSGNKSHSLLNPILNTKNENRLKEEIMKLFKKYNYSIKKDSKRFNNLYSMILAYKPETKINDDLLLAGYLNSSLIYEKMEEKGNE